MSQAAVRWVETDGARSDHRPLPSPPPGWIPVPSIASHVHGTTAKARSKKAERIARKLAKSDPLLTCIVGNTAYVAPHAPLGETTVAAVIGRARIENADGSYRPPPERLEQWAKMSAPQREACALKWRAWLAWCDVCRRFGGRSESDRLAILRAEIGQLFEIVGQHFPTTARTLRDWRDITDPRPGNARWTGACDRRGRPDRQALAEDCPDFWIAFEDYWLLPSKPSVKAAWRRACEVCEARGLPAPSYQVTNKERHRRLPDCAADLKRLGPREYERKWETRARRSYAHESRPGETWVCDFHKLDCWVVDSRGKLIRPYLCVFLDERSRKVMAWGIVERETSDNVIVIFARGVREHGAPLRVRCDNGRAFVAKTVGGKRSDAGKRRVESLFARLSVEVTWARPYNPGTKHVERFFRTVCEQFSKFVATYAGNSPVSRPEELPKALKSGDVEAPSIEAIRVSFGEWADRYNSQPHSGDAMNDRSPHEVFATENPIAKRTAPEDVLEAVLSHRELVKVTREGIRFRGLSYPDRRRKLDPFRTKLVTVQARLDDLRRISIFDEAGTTHICDLEERSRQKLTIDDVREAQSEKKAARKKMKAYFPASVTARKSVERVAGEIAAEREARQAKKQPKRMAAGAESFMEDPRNIALIPGVAHFAPAGNTANAARDDDFVESANDRVQSAFNTLHDKEEAEKKRRAARDDDDDFTNLPDSQPIQTYLQRLSAPPADAAGRLSDDLDDDFSVWDGPEPDGPPMKPIYGAHRFEPRPIYQDDDDEGGAA
ncbi:MAG: DDE-type integrase/transposase/recombinase [Phycisphaerae bacterium]|nr:DDE-type integrase/transposase/recombinase [Phycisphaerae bacterium]